MVSIGQIVEVIEETNKDVERNRRELSDTQQFSVDNKNTSQSSFQQSITISKFKVRVPLLHGIAGEASAVPNSQLPDATFCAMPGSEQTKLNNGDLVYVAVVDFDYSKIVIIGFVSSDQATQSRSGAALTRVQKLEMANNGEALFSQNITISDGEDEITWTNLKSLSGFTNRLQDYVWPIENGGTGISINKKLSNSQVESAQKKMRDNFGIFSTKIVSSSEFDKIQSNNKYEKNTIYYIWDDDSAT